MLEQIVNWNIDRGIPKVFSRDAEYDMLEEELEEFDVAMTDDERVDALADLVVIAVGSMWKLGYNPDHVMEEVLKEINSRGGAFDPGTGKWMKETTGSEYKAEYTKETHE